jgi:hypothetical protein
LEEAVVVVLWPQPGSATNRAAKPDDTKYLDDGGLVRSRISIPRRYGLRLPYVLLSTLFGKDGGHDSWSKKISGRRPRNTYGCPVRLVPSERERLSNEKTGDDDECGLERRSGRKRNDCEVLAALIKGRGIPK